MSARNSLDQKIEINPTSRHVKMRLMSEFLLYKKWLPKVDRIYLDQNWVYHNIDYDNSQINSGFALEAEYGHHEEPDWPYLDTNTFFDDHYIVTEPHIDFESNYVEMTGVDWVKEILHGRCLKFQIYSRLKGKPIFEVNNLRKVVKYDENIYKWDLFGIEIMLNHDAYKVHFLGGGFILSELINKGGYELK